MPERCQALLSDSVLQEEPFALARGGEATARAVTFSSAELTIDIEVHVDDEARTLMGQLSPPAAAGIEVQTTSDEVVSGMADELGRFRVRLAIGGPIRLRVLVADDNPPVETSWITV